MAQVPTGSTFFVATAFGSPVAVTAISNATEAVVTAAAHGFANGDLVEMTSSWGRLQKRAFRVKTSLAGTFVLEGADTSSLSFFPAGGGAGSVRKVSTLVQVTQVMNPNASGGEAKKVTYKYVESDVEYSINDGFSAVNRTFEIDADAIGSAGYTALKALTDVQSDTILKTMSKSGAFTLLPCTVALNEEVIYQDGQINRVKVDFSGNNKSTRYAA
jgi:hypothetical protein